MRCSIPQLSELFTEEMPLENFESAIQKLIGIDPVPMFKQSKRFLFLILIWCDHGQWLKYALPFFFFSI